jgi:hypothetical protein
MGHSLSNMLYKDRETQTKDENVGWIEERGGDSGLCVGPTAHAHQTQ